MRFIYCLLFLFVASSSSATELVGSSDRLAFWQKIQGNWRGSCQPNKNVKTGYHITKIKVSFTHFNVTTNKYASDKCLKLRSSHTASYKYVLGEPEKSADGSAVWTIDFLQEASDSQAVPLTPKNIILVAGGELYLGHSRAIPDGKRLKRLDRKNFLTR